MWGSPAPKLHIRSTPTQGARQLITIIECLKYATTGDLPPNSKGGAFIHDPKLCGEKEVLAQVKLSFKGNSGSKMVVTRSLQLTVKKTTRQQKTLEGNLLVIKDGERTALSSRVAELDQMMPQYLGVSRAVLDSVIFCHQDESLWPMSEPSVLKKRFDEIFEALKYTKAIDNIKVLRKKQAEELGKHKLLEQQYKIDKERADRAERQSRALADEIEALRFETTNLKHDLERITKESDKLWSQASEFEQIVANLKAKREKVRDKKESVDELSQHIEHLDRSDESISSELENYEERMSGLQAEIQSWSEQLQHFNELLDEARRKLQVKLTETGKYEAERSQHERQLQRRVELIKGSARRHNIRGFDADLDDDAIRDFMAKVNKLSRDQNLNLERERRESRDRLQEVQATLNQLGERRSALSQTKDYAKQEIATNEEKVTSFQTEIDRLEMDETRQSSLQSAVDETNTNLVSAKQMFVSADWDQKIQSANAELRTYEDAGQALNTELINSTRQAGELAKAQFLQKELKDRQRSLESLTGTHGDKLGEVVGLNWRPMTLERDFQLEVDQKRKDLGKAEDERDVTSREFEQTEFRLNTKRDKLKEDRKTVKECEKRIRDGTSEEPDGYPAYVSQLETDYEVLKSDVRNFTNLQAYFESGIKIATENSACRLCQRQFGSKKEQSQFVGRLKKLISDQGLEKSEQELAEVEEELRAAKAMSSSYDSFIRLSNTEIPTTTREIQALESERDRVAARIETHDEAVKQQRDAQRELDMLSKTVQTISKYHEELISLEAQLKEISSSQQTGAIARPVDEIQSELESQGEKVRMAKSVVNRLNVDKDQARNRTNALELELRDAKTKLKDASYQLERKKDLESRVQDLREASVKQRATIQQAEAEMGTLSPKVDKSQAEYDVLEQRGLDREKVLQEEASRLLETLNQLRASEQEINLYLDKGGPEQVSKSQREVDTIKKELEKLEADQKQTSLRIDEAQKQHDKQNQVKRTLADNLRYRRDVKALEQLKTEIEELEAKNAEVDRDRFVAEANKMSVQHRKLSAEEASKMGAMKSKDDQLMKLLADWQTDYKDAAKNFKEAHIRVETTKAAVEDLRRYGSALDNAIMKYHGLKMEQINRIVDELWKKTYQGTDVDTVLIRSDNETGVGNRSYNYRVCMVKQDAEMDMRGRCSAGQKVLASIIIRLALAECFGTNCGLIALDEPTTNLDRDNIRSLAESLHDIIRARQQQANFQLIVITHDEDFLRNMQCADFCDNYYRVTRDASQKSIIERQSIAEVV
ncbi:MAG: hypothetical protein M1825_000494 [Sarcosagium campestre]|nr:MAG: hypothetical protein M1825_000494 [Sarcosagium campestre]